MYQSILLAVALGVSQYTGSSQISSAQWQNAPTPVYDAFDAWVKYPDGYFKVPIVNKCMPEILETYDRFGKPVWYYDYGRRIPYLKSKEKSATPAGMRRPSEVDEDK